MSLVVLRNGRLDINDVSFYRLPVPFFFILIGEISTAMAIHKSTRVKNVNMIIRDQHVAAQHNFDLVRSLISRWRSDCRFLVPQNCLPCLLRSSFYIV